MRKIFFVLLSTSIACISLQAQADSAFAAVRYNFLYVSDTTQPAEVSSESMVLYLGKNISVYKSYDRVLRDSAMKEQILKAKMAMDRTGILSSFGTPGMKSGTASAIYKETTTSKIKRIENLIKNYVIDEPQAEIQWAITQETKTIQELPCQKATANFRGRNYTAWFCAQLPYNNGPWKLGGLPGLIIEAADEKNEVVFSFQGFDDVSGKHIAIAVPADAIKATDKEYRQLQEAARNDPQGFLNNALGGTGGSIKMNSGSFTPNPGFKRKVNNNPIEKSM